MSICVYLWLIFLTSCGSKPTDLRTLIPADSLVYLESNDLGAVMNAITERPAFREAAKTVPDFSILNGVKLAVAVTGFETKELPVTDENSVLSFTPHFVAVLETNAWNFQAISFTQDKLGEFINQVYGGEVLLETSDKHDGKYFVWTAKDGRKAFALVQGSVVFFGNDETSIDKCLAVKRGEADSIAKNPKITNGDRLAFGYVSPDGIAQLSNIVGLQIALGASEQDEIRQFVSMLVPKILRNSIEEVSWTSKAIEGGIEDDFNLRPARNLGKLFADTLGQSNEGSIKEDRLLQFFPDEVISATRYDLKNPQLAWRSLLLSAAANYEDPSFDVVASNLFGQILEPYGIEEDEMFLSSVGNIIYTVRFDPDDQEIAVLGTVGDRAKLLRSVMKEMKTSGAAKKNGVIELWQSDNGYSLAILGEMFVLGDSNSVQKCLAAEASNTRSAIAERLRTIAFGSTALTVSRNSDLTTRVVDVLTETNETRNVIRESRISTNFKSDRIERREVSDFGFIGWIITQFGKEQ